MLPRVFLCSWRYPATIIVPMVRFPPGAGVRHAAAGNCRVARLLDRTSAVDRFCVALDTLRWASFVEQVIKKADLSLSVSCFRTRNW